MRRAANAGRGMLLGLVLAVGCAGAAAGTVSALAVAGPTAPAPAQSAKPVKPAKKGVTISPPLQEITLGPGLLEATTDIGLTNNSGADLTASVKVVDFKALDEFGGVSLGQAGQPLAKYGLANWLSLPGGNSFRLAKGQAAQLRVNIENRADLAPGGHYGAVVVTASAPAGAAGNQVSLKQELVSLLFVKKTGGEHYGLKLQSLTRDKGSGIPATVSLRFASTGNVHVVPRGYVTVTDPKGTLVAKGIIDPESTLVLPGTSRQFVTLLQPVADATRSGRYTVTAYYRHDGQTAFAAQAIYFNRGTWSPRRIIIAIITGVIVLLIVYKLQRSRRKRRRVPTGSRPAA